ncbi:MAG: hypothetical protein K6B46_02465 [Opitutales bacterium]|nr:hypothetical protein [Opitutales bacterium]
MSVLAVVVPANFGEIKIAFPWIFAGTRFFCSPIAFRERREQKFKHRDTEAWLGMFLGSTDFRI